jgi:CBS domain containing-hemolysin-like protein
MMEMACVSFNKVRLNYYVSQGNKRAKWLSYLLRHPFRLFGTTLIGVNVAMVVGSECAREFHSSIGLSPDLAPLSQVALVVIFGELAPMFAARHYPEYIAMMGAPMIYASAKVLSPALWLIGWVTKAANFLIKGKTIQTDIFLSQEELQKILEEKGEPMAGGDVQEFNVITRNIFSLRHKKAKEVMTSLDLIPRLPSNATIAQMKELIKRTNADFVTIYYKEFSNIVGIAFPRDLIRIPDNKRVRDYAKPPWFVTENTPLTQLLHQFQRNNENVSVILDKKGKAKGLIALEDLLTEIFGEGIYKPSDEKSLFFMERTFSGNMKVGEFKEQFDVILDPDPDLTLSQLMTKVLGRHPEEADIIYIEPLELIAKETSLLEVKSVIVKTRPTP